MIGIATICTTSARAAPTQFRDEVATLDKRAPPMSVNQDLQHLADIYNDGSEAGTKALLNRLGKRAPAMSINQDLQTLTGDSCVVIVNNTVNDNIQ